MPAEYKNAKLCPRHLGTEAVYVFNEHTLN